MKPGEVLKTTFPAGSRILLAKAGADFSDSYRFASAEPEASALEQFLTLSARTPAWMNFLMSLRNQVVGWVGLKDLGGMAVSDSRKPASSYRPGDRVGIFTLQYADDREVILEDRDKHLHVQVSLFRLGEAELQMSTVVHIHNRLGRLYMSVVGPVHGLIVPMMLRQRGNVR
ncbi:DUF2867 domain-containing protein [Roseateles oligotrophus]|uniref:DUF2867 domain-containing protein n=1 Tax=Roseateles oligotrophus TaxID=1769250 RepID=A0ABT2YKP3_9BURK|nr:DUF2867 domain-containing protein [Roseateles oligotrophus]MCV2370629.1 DUF2867 domain-containing protein [Roseateles oligotrophus]